MADRSMAAAYWAAHSGAFNETSVAKEAHGVSRFAARPSTPQRRSWLQLRGIDDRPTRFLAAAIACAAPHMAHMQPAGALAFRGAWQDVRERWVPARPQFKRQVTQRPATSQGPTSQKASCGTCVYDLCAY